MPKIFIMKHLPIKLSLFLNYFVFAILLNSVGTVILQVQRNFDISKADASILEAFKDLPIAITSFLVAAFLPKIGLKKSMLIGLAFVAIICAIIPTANEFWYFKMLFLVIGVSFALIKVAAFATIGIITENKKEHASFMNLLEAVFMGALLIGILTTSYFIDDNDSKSKGWLTIYWLLSGISIVAFFLLFFTKLDEKEAKIETRSITNDFAEMFQIMVKPLSIVFIVSIFFYVLIEQSFSNWLPTFYNDVINAPAKMAIQSGAILAGATFLGRLASGFVLLRVKWIYYLSFCLLAVAAIVLLVLPIAQSYVADANLKMSWLNAPTFVYLLPLMGLFLAPIYPTINSTILSSLPKYMHSSMSGLIVVFSALGGTTGSIITGHIFQAFDGITAFYFSLVPITVIFVALWILHKITSKNARV
jgi:fucose permease